MGRAGLIVALGLASMASPAVPDSLPNPVLQGTRLSGYPLGQYPPGRDDVARLPQRAGADVAGGDGRCQTPMALAIRCRHLSTVRLLLEAGAPVAKPQYCQAENSAFSVSREVGDRESLQLVESDAGAPGDEP